MCWHTFLNDHTRSKDIKLIHEWHSLIFSRLSYFREGSWVLNQRGKDLHESSLHSWCKFRFVTREHVQKIRYLSSRVEILNLGRFFTRHVFEIFLLWLHLCGGSILIICHLDKVFLLRNILTYGVTTTCLAYNSVAPYRA